MKLCPISGQPMAEVVTTPPFRPMTEDDVYWSLKSDRVSREYLKAIERVGGTGARRFEMGIATIQVMKFPRGQNKAFLTQSYIDPGGWHIATFHLTDDATMHVDLGTTWMSICPMELQSHVNPIKWAQGRVLVLGLGMGYFVREILKKRTVTEIVVIEREADAIRLYRRLFGNNERIKLVHADVFQHEDKSRYDFAYADIWREMDEAKADMSKILPRYDARTWGYWGMERAAIEACNPNSGQTFLDLIGALHCPVTVQQTKDIAALILKLIPERAGA